MFRSNFQKEHLDVADDLNINKYSLIVLNAFGTKKQSWLTLENEPVLTQNRNSDSGECAVPESEEIVQPHSYVNIKGWVGTCVVSSP